MVSGGQNGRKGLVANVRLLVLCFQISKGDNSLDNFNSCGLCLHDLNCLVIYSQR